MDFREAFKILEIEPTDDKKKIKVAYSKILKKYHPEDFPEMFMKINEAYEIALEYSEEEEYEEYDYDEVFYETDFEILDEEDGEFSDVFSGEYEWKEKNFDDWLRKFYRILNGEKISFINLKIFLKKFDRFSESEKNRIRDILNLENVDYEGNLILNSDNILEFEKEYIISRLTDGKTELEKIRRLYSSNEEKDKDKAVENFVEKYFHVKKLNFFVFFVFWNIYHGDYEYFDIKINKKIYNFFFVLTNNLFLKRIVYSYKEIQKIFYRMGIKCEDDIKEEDEILYSLVFVLSSLALVFIWIFSLPVITNMGLEEIGYEDIIVSFESVKTFWIVLTITRVYYDIMIAKRGNNLNMTSMLYVQIILLGSYLISIYFKYEIKDILLLAILVWLVIKLMIVNSIKYYRLANYAKKILDKIY
ncbi:J domain-containing protein [Leptotrichia massiliensis]|uniref:J domain-containing protein n=1 Tax=Leptotrichia massiliensis TaxID=1852388 RepID=UPI0008DA1A20|nr:DnaJ domain-containing protein [Leptotrichia massiliensis]